MVRCPTPPPLKDIAITPTRSVPSSSGTQTRSRSPFWLDAVRTVVVVNARPATVPATDCGWAPTSAAAGEGSGTSISCSRSLRYTTTSRAPIVAASSATTSARSAAVLRCVRRSRPRISLAIASSLTGGRVASDGMRAGVSVTPGALRLADDRYDRRLGGGGGLAGPTCEPPFFASLQGQGARQEAERDA